MIQANGHIFMWSQVWIRRDSKSTLISQELVVLWSSKQTHTVPAMANYCSPVSGNKDTNPLHIIAINEVKKTSQERQTFWSVFMKLTLHHTVSQSSYLTLMKTGISNYPSGLGRAENAVLVCTV